MIMLLFNRVAYDKEESNHQLQIFRLMEGFVYGYVAFRLLRSQYKRNIWSDHRYLFTVIGIGVSGIGMIMVSYV